MGVSHFFQYIAKVHYFLGIREKCRNRNGRPRLPFFGEILNAFFGQLLLLFDEATTAVESSCALGRQWTNFVVAHKLARDMMQHQLPHLFQWFLPSDFRNGVLRICYSDLRLGWRWRLICDECVVRRARRVLRLKLDNKHRIMKM